jgi:microcystin-dependent protein
MGLGKQGVEDLNPSQFPFSAFEADNPDATATPVLELKSPWSLLAKLVTIPAGVIQMFGGAAAPTGFLLCDGTSYLRADYPDLFAAIGTTFGPADGTHFLVPNFSGGILPAMPGTQSVHGRTKTGPDLGTVLEDQSQEHQHIQAINMAGWSAPYGSGPDTQTLGRDSGTTSMATPLVSVEKQASGFDAPRTGQYVRPNELGVNFIIKT